MGRIGVVRTDPDDDQVIAAALAAQAELVASGARDLLALSSHGEIAICTSAQALARIAAAK